MSIYLNILLITIITCYLIDVTGIIDTIKYSLRRMLNIRSSTQISMKPFDCSLCMSHHINILYLFYILLYNGITFTSFLCCYAFILFCSCNTIFITSSLNLISEILNNIINKIYNIIDK